MDEQSLPDTQETMAPEVNVSPMSPKFVCTYPHIVENRGITMAQGMR
jgi:hypothetical protein